MAPSDLDDLRLDLFARLLPLAHADSVTENENTALDFSARPCQPDREHRSRISKGTMMTVRYDEPNRAARAGNELIRWLAEAGISIAGTRALRVRGRKTGKRRGVVINLLTV